MRRDVTESGDAAISAKGAWLIWIKEIWDSILIMPLSAPVEAPSE